MQPLKVTKSEWGRRRFVRSKLLVSIDFWQEELLKLKDKVLTETTLQIIGPEAVIAINEADEAELLVEVLGLPTEVLELIDSEGAETYVYQCPESIFELDFLGLIKRAREIERMLKSKFPQSMEPVFHIVIDGQKIALHFFRQKDYSQSNTQSGALI